MSSSFAKLNGALMQPVGHTVKGVGQIDAALTNNGTISAENVSGSTGTTLSISGATTNNALMRATSGRILSFASGVLSNLSGTTLTGGSYQLGANSTITLPGSIATNAASIKLGGANTTFTALSSLSSNTGTLTLASERIVQPHRRINELRHDRSMAAARFG